MTYVIIKLRNGVEVTGIVIDENDRSITLGNAMTIKYKFDYTYNKPVIYLSKYSPFSKNYEVTFRFDDVSHVFRDPIDEFVDYYNKHMSRLLNKDVKWDIEYNERSDLEKRTNPKNREKVNLNEQQQILDAFEELMSSNTSIN